MEDDGFEVYCRDYLGRFGNVIYGKIMLISIQKLHCTGYNELDDCS